MPSVDPLLGDLDRRDIACVAQDRRGAVADLAHGRDRNVAAHERRIGRGELGAGEALEAVELGAAQHEMDRLELGAVERARRPLDAALNFEPALRRRRWRRLGESLPRASAEPTCAYDWAWSVDGSAAKQQPAGGAREGRGAPSRMTPAMVHV